MSHMNIPTRACDHIINRLFRQKLNEEAAAHFYIGKNLRVTEI